MRRWKVVALVAAAVTLLAWLAAAVQPKRYRAVAIGAVAPRVAEMTKSETLHGVDTLERRVVVATVAALASTPLTIRQLGAGTGYDVRAVVVPTTNLFRVTVEGEDPKRVAAIANAVPSAISEQAHRMYQLYTVILISPAVVPDAAEFPRVERAVVAGLILGLLAGVGAAWLLDRRSRA